jgi:hypothetical protein
MASRQQSLTGMQPTTDGSGKPPWNHAKAAYVCHVVLAVCMAIVLAMQVHLWAIDAKGDVVGGAIFLLIMALGLPALVAAILVLVFTWKTSDARMKWMLVALALPALMVLFGVPAVMLWIAQAVYIASVLAGGIIGRGVRA